MIYFFLFGLFFWCFSLSPVHAAFIHYELTTKKVYATDTDVPPQPGYAVFTVPGLVRDIPWPAPSGCPKGQLEWTIVDDATPPPRLILNPTLKFFRCQFVASAKGVDHVVNREAAQLSRIVEEMNTRHTLFVWADSILAKCTSANISSMPDVISNLECEALRPRAVTLWKLLVRSQAFSQALGEFFTLRTEGETFKTAQGW